MIPLARVKLSNNYDLVRDNLTVETGSEPITDTEGTTVLLLDDGTSWEFVGGDWSQIEVEQDRAILNSLYAFMGTVCESINNFFIKPQLSAVYQGVLLS